jgi:hypothetical protein
MPFNPGYLLSPSNNCPLLQGTSKISKNLSSIKLPMRNYNFLQFLSPSSSFGVTMNSNLDLCTTCNAPATQYCEHCHVVAYCTDECRQTDSPVHKTVCPSYTTLPSRPSPNHRRAILFPAQDPPKFVWVECNHLPGWTTSHQSVRFESFLQNTAGRPPVERLVSSNIYRRRLLKPEIAVYNLHRTTMYQLPANISIRNLAHEQTPLRPHRDWWGPVIVLGVTVQQNMIETFEDLTITNFQDVVDFLCFHWTDLVPLQPNILFEPAQRVQGIKISCKKDQRELFVHKYSSYSVTQYHLIYHPAYGSMSPVSTYIGIPLLMYRCPPEGDANHQSAAPDGFDPLVNKEASLLQTILDPNHENWGAVSAGWEGCQGNVVLVRQDGRDLAGQHVEALVEYGRNVVWPRMDAATVGTRRAVTATVNHLDFRVFWEKMITDKEFEDWMWMDVTSPF